MRYQDLHVYKCRGNFWKKEHLMDACIEIPHLNVLPKRTKRQNTYKAENASINKKELVVMLEKINVQLPALGLANNTPSWNTPYNSNKFPNLKEMDSQRKKINNKEVVLSHLIPEKQSLLNRMTKDANNDLSSSSEFLDKTMLNLDSLCRSEMPVPFWYNDELEPTPTLEVSHRDNFVPLFNLNIDTPVLTPGRIMPTNSGSAKIELEFTPPSSSTCDSIVSCSTSDSEDSFAENVANLEGLVQVQVAIEPCVPSLRQLQDLYRRKKRTKTKKVNYRTSFRERRLRPSNALRQLTPYMIEAPLHKKHGKNSLLKKRGENSHKRHKKRSAITTKASCQTQLFLNAKQHLLKLEIQQRKQAIKFRNKFENALDSINQRIFRQSHFWKMLPS